MHFGFALELSNVDLLNIDLLDTHLDLLDTGIPSIFLFFIMSSRHVFKTCLQDVFSVTTFRFPRLLQDVLQDVFKTSSRHLCKTSSRRLQDVLEGAKLLR